MPKHKEKLNLAEMRQHEVDALFARSAMTAGERAADFLAFKAGREFGLAHPEFNGTEYNIALLTQYVSAMGWPDDRDSLEKAYFELTAEGALE